MRTTTYSINLPLLHYRSKLVHYVDLPTIPLYNSDIESQDDRQLSNVKKSIQKADNVLIVTQNGSWYLNKLKRERCEEVMSKQKVYYGKDIEVMFNSEVCIHSGICVKGLPDVFDLSKRPWVNPDADTTEAIARHIDTCPSGALTYRRLDGEYLTEKEG